MFINIMHIGIVSALEPHLTSQELGDKRNLCFLKKILEIEFICSLKTNKMITTLSRSVEVYSKSSESLQRKS